MAKPIQYCKVISLQLNKFIKKKKNGLVGSPCSPRDSQESSPTPQFKSINSSVLSFLHSVGKESACSAGDPGSVPGLGRSPGEGNGNLLQYSCLENSQDRGTWQAISHVYLTTSLSIHPLMDT